MRKMRGNSMGQNATRHSRRPLFHYIVIRHTLPFTTLISRRFITPPLRRLMMLRLRRHVGTMEQAESATARGRNRLMISCLSRSPLRSLAHGFLLLSRALIRFAAAYARAYNGQFFSPMLMFAEMPLYDIAALRFSFSYLCSGTRGMMLPSMPPIFMPLR